MQNSLEHKKIKLLNIFWASAFANPIRKGMNFKNKKPVPNYMFSTGFITRTRIWYKKQSCQYCYTTFLKAGSCLSSKHMTFVAQCLGVSGFNLCVLWFLYIETSL